MKLVDGNEFNVAKRTIASTKLSDNDKVISVMPVHIGTDDAAASGNAHGNMLLTEQPTHVVLQTHKGVFLKFALEEVPEKKKGAVGVRGIKLAADDSVDNIYLLNKDHETMITYNEKVMSLNKLKTAHRDGKGTKVRI